MAQEHGRRREDVVAWPSDVEAREALESYLDSFATAGDRHPTLGADLLDLRGAELRGLDLASAYLFNTVLAGVNLANANLVRATLSGADLRFADLTGADLYKAEADECLADGAIFREAELFAVYFGRARLVECDFRGATLNSVRLRCADLTRADLRTASLPDARFGDDEDPTVVTAARMFACDIAGAHGTVVGPVDIGEDEPALVDGTELLAWFAAQGAPNITLAS